MVSLSHSMFIFKTVSVPQTNFSYELFKYFNVSPHPETDTEAYVQSHISI